MYRGLARLVGMTVVEPGKTLADQFEVAKTNWDKYDFFFIHYKYTDSTGEDGNFAKKVEVIEALDAEIPKLKALKPDVLIVTGDHDSLRDDGSRYAARLNEAGVAARLLTYPMFHNIALPETTEQMFSEMIETLQPLLS